MYTKSVSCRTEGEKILENQVRTDIGVTHAKCSARWEKVCLERLSGGIKESSLRIFCAFFVAFRQKPCMFLCLSLFLHGNNEQAVANQEEMLSDNPVIYIKRCNLFCGESLVDKAGYTAKK